MNKCLLTFVGVMSVMSYSPLCARELTADQALARVVQEPSQLRSHGVAAKSAYELNYTARLSDGSAAFYAFNRKQGDGFMILSADDNMAPMLGVCDNAVFDYDNIPENFRWWLSQYASEAEQLRSDNESVNPYKVSSRAESRKDVSPLLTCRWDQDWPYSNRCPNNGNVATGCVATAMAMVMYYHKYAKGAGSYTYTLSNVTGNITYDFSTLDLDWANMTNLYNSSSTQESCDAVAELMFACGVSVHMMYTSSESSAYDFAVPRALYKYFGYDGGVRYVKRDNYTSDDWEDMIYNEIVSSRPFIYGGSTPSDGGHQFVCDGYRASDNTFHFNWGWSGLYDGYFVTTGLNPAGSGIGGYSGGYNKNQSATIGIRPNADSPHFIPLMSTTDIEYVSKSGSAFQVRLMAYMPYPEDTKITLGVKIDDNKGFSRYMNVRTQTFPGVDLALGELASLYYLNYDFSGENLPDGVYTITPVYKTIEMDWEKIGLPASGRQCVYLTVSNGEMEMSNDAPSGLVTSVSTLSGSADIELVDVYGIDGTLVKQQVPEQQLNDLFHGLYIIKTPTKTYKLRVR